MRAAAFSAKAIASKPLIQAEVLLRGAVTYKHQCALILNEHVKQPWCTNTWTIHLRPLLVLVGQQRRLLTARVGADHQIQLQIKCILYVLSFIGVVGEMGNIVSKMGSLYKKFWKEK